MIDSSKIHTLLNKVIKDIQDRIDKGKYTDSDVENLIKLLRIIPPSRERKTRIPISILPSELSISEFNNSLHDNGLTVETVGSVHDSKQVIGGRGDVSHGTPSQAGGLKIQPPISLSDPDLDALYASVEEDPL